MLEVRSAYGWYGSEGGVTGENTPPQRVRVPYREYKTKWKDHRVVEGTYDPQTKTIEVYFTDEEMKQKTNLGNRYQLDYFYFLMDGVDVYRARNVAKEMRIVEFHAKTLQNAERNAKRKAKEYGWILIRQATREDFNQYKEMGTWY